MKKERLAGLDILRILSMLGIVGLHIINEGGLRCTLPINSISYFVVMILLTILFTSVNIFALLTGYLNINKENNKCN